MTWWHKASREQRLARIDSGLELGMTARQMALALQCSMRNVQEFVRDNGRQFTDPHGGNAVAVRSSRRMGEMKRLKWAFLRGDKVDLSGTAAPDRDDFALDEVPA